MLLQLMALWGIVIATVTWFVRDERRLRAEAERAKAVSYYAHAPKYRHVAIDEPVAVPAQRVGGLTETQRRFLKDFADRA
jgi:hypothetical protein